MVIFEPVINTSKSIGVIDIYEHDISVPTDFHDKHDFLHDLFESILCVEEKYLLYKDKATGQEQKHLERVFAYELYRQWANRIQIKWGDKLVINGEIGKEPKLFDHYRSKVHKFPDLVLHAGQGNHDFQGLVRYVTAIGDKRLFPHHLHTIGKDINGLIDIDAKDLVADETFVAAGATVVDT